MLKAYLLRTWVALLRSGPRGASCQGMLCGQHLPGTAAPSRQRPKLPVAGGALASSRLGAAGHIVGLFAGPNGATQTDEPEWFPSKVVLFTPSMGT